MDRSAEIRFDGWTLLRQSGELLRDGRRIRLQDQPLHILEELLARPGELVSREQLISKLWPKQVVDYDTALNAAVRRLRAALGDEADTPRYIETIPRRGYRFVGGLDVESLQANVESPVSGIGRKKIGALALAAAGVAILLWALWVRDSGRLTEPAGSPGAGMPRSIVVLPFVDLVAGGDSKHFADGLTEELINRLARSDQLRVIARTSAFAYQGKTVDIETVARQLGVTHVLEGSVRGSGNRLRVTAQLIDASTNSHLWSQQYDRRLGDIFDIQDDIATNVTAALEASFADGDKAQRRPDPRAYEKLLLGRFLFNRRAPGDIELAREHFEQAISIDPDFARAWAALAGIYWIQVTDGTLERVVGLAKLEQAAKKALALDPDLAEPHARLAIHAWAVGDREAARLHWQRAAELEPNNALVIGAAIRDAFAAGREDEVLALNQRLIDLDPLSTVTHYNLAWQLYAFGRFERAIAEMRRVIELNPSHSREIYCFSLVMLGRFGEAQDLARNWPDSAEKQQCETLYGHGLGQRARSDAALAALTAESEASDPFRIAEAHAYRGEADAAFEWLARTSKFCSSRSEFSKECIKNIQDRSPLLASLHSDPRWKEWVRTRR